MRSIALSSVFLTFRCPPISPLFPYTTLFRSGGASGQQSFASPIAQRHYLPRRHLAWRNGSCCSHRRGRQPRQCEQDRKSTRLNSSHVKISYAVFCLKKKRSYGRTQRSEAALT